MDNCIFCKIARGEIPSRKVYEDDEILAFHDINPIAPMHLMVIAKKHMRSLAEVGFDHTRVRGSPGVYRTIVNTGRIGRQDVMHVHVHVIGGPTPLGPMLVRSSTS